MFIDILRFIILSRDSDSLIEQMRTSSAGINLYVADAISASNVKLYYDYSTTKVTSIFNYLRHNSSLHTVIIMKTNTYDPMKDVYERVHYAIDTISNEIMLKTFEGDIKIQKPEEIKVAYRKHLTINNI